MTVTACLICDPVEGGLAWMVIGAPYRGHLSQSAEAVRLCRATGMAAIA